MSDLILFAAAEGVTLSTASVLAILGGAASSIGGLFALLMKNKEREYERLAADLTEAKENYEKLAAEALTFATEQANWAMRQQNLPPIVLAAPVVPRSQSPSTLKQRETARLGTMVANLAHLKLMMGVAARPVPPRAEQSEEEHNRENRLEDAVRAPQAISPQVVVPATTLSRPETTATALTKAIEAVPDKVATKLSEKIEAVPDKVVQKLEERHPPSR